MSNTVKKNVKKYQRQADGTYIEVAMDPVVEKRCESEESKTLRGIAKYGRKEFRHKIMGTWVELWLVPAGTYMVFEQKIAIPNMYIILTKSWACQMQLDPRCTRA